MSLFHFHVPDAQEQLFIRSHEQEAVLTLRSCKALATRLGCEQGILTPLTAEEEVILQAYSRIQGSYEGYQYEGIFECLYKKAGLLHSDVGLLSGRVLSLYQERQPALYEAEVIVLLEQMLRLPEG